MDATAFHIVNADWERDCTALRHVRGIVFISEQNVPVELEWDGMDSACEHLLALDAADQPIGTARLMPEHIIGRMAVVQAWRGRGVGAALLGKLLERARTLGWPRVTLHAQVEAIGFYQRFGFACHGSEFMEAGIRHRSMTLDLAPMDAAATGNCR